MNYLLKLNRYILSILICVNAIVLICDFTSNRIYASDTRNIEGAKKLLVAKITSLQKGSSGQILLSNMELEEILETFSGMKYTFGELAFEFLLLSKKLGKTIVIKNASSVFNKYKENLSQQYTRFDSIEYHGEQNYILIRLSPNSEDGQFYVEMIDGRNIYQKRELLLSVSTVSDIKVKVKNGIFSSDEVFIKSGISFKYREGDEQVDSKSILGLLPMTEKIVVIEGDLMGKKLNKGSFVQVLGKKYGGVETFGDYIK